MNNDDIIQSFMKSTGCYNRAKAQQYLDLAEGELETATALYKSEQLVPEAPATTSRPANVSSSTDTRVMTMADLNRASNQHLDDADRSNNYYAGGSSNSGIQISGYDRGSDVKKLVFDVFENAKKRFGASTEEIPQERQKFSGSGYRLGDTNVEGYIRPIVEGKDEERVSKVIVFYRNGFTVDNGNLRSYAEPENAQFLDDINQGYVPKELETSAGRRKVYTKLVDKTHEDYTESDKPRTVPFSGSGFSLKNDLPNMETPVHTPSSSKPFILDDSLPTVQIRVRFHDGSLKLAKLNLSHSIMDLRNWIDNNNPTNGQYDLLVTFPTKTLSDMNQTIEAAELSGALVIQRMK